MIHGDAAMMVVLVVEVMAVQTVAVVAKEVSAAPRHTLFLQPLCPATHYRFSAMQVFLPKQP